MSTVAALGAAIVACAPATAGAAGLASDLGPGVEVTRQDETRKVGFIGTDPGQPSWSLVDGLVTGLLPQNAGAACATT